MHENTILSLADAARLVHATPETLLRYIRDGELMAARVGKNFVMTHASLTAFVNALATRQGTERQAKQCQLEHDGVPAKSGGCAGKPPVFVQVTEMGHAEPTNKKRKGRRTPVPALPSSLP